MQNSDTSSKCVCLWFVLSLKIKIVFENVRLPLPKKFMYLASHGIFYMYMLHAY